MGVVDVKMQFRRISAVIAAQAEAGGATGHTSTTGRIREMIVHQFLQPHLPRTRETKAGIIFDSIGGTSAQQDVIIVDTRLPLVDIGAETEAVVMAEAAVATIEVKSFLNTDELKKALKSIARTKALKRRGQHVYEKGGVITKYPDPFPILGYVFAYDGLELDTLLKALNAFATEHNTTAVLPDAVCVLTKGVIYRQPEYATISGPNVQLPPTAQMATLTVEPLKKDALYAFYRRLVDDIVPLRIEHIDLDAFYPGRAME